MRDAIKPKNATAKTTKRLVSPRKTQLTTWIYLILPTRIGALFSTLSLRSFPILLSATFLYESEASDIGSNRVLFWLPSSPPFLPKSVVCYGPHLFPSAVHVHRYLADNRQNGQGVRRLNEESNRNFFEYSGSIQQIMMSTQWISSIILRLFLSFAFHLSSLSNHFGRLLFPSVVIYGLVPS